MPKFFCDGFGEHCPVLRGADAAHIARSLRMKTGETLSVSDLQGQVYDCSIVALRDDEVQLQIDGVRADTAEPSVQVTLFQCMPKGDKLETVVQKSVELGVAEIVPVLSSRCISRPDAKSAAKKRERLQRIAEEAAKQSGRGILPAVGEMISFAQMLQQLQEFDSVLLFYEGGGRPVNELAQGKKIAVVIGPEGGFDQSEVQQAEQAGAKIASLGPRILRTETAPLAALSLIMFVTGNLQ